MEERIDIPDLDEITDLGSAKFLLGHLSRALQQQHGQIEQQSTLIRTLQETIEALRHDIAELSRSHHGQKSERVVPVDRELRKERRAEETAEERAERLEKTRLKRERNREKRREKTPTVVIEHPVVDESCTTCGCPVDNAAPLADEVSEEYEYVPAHIIRREHWRRRKVCHCGQFFVAPAPPRVVEGGIYGPGLHARTAVAKCADSIPLDRLAKGFRRAGVPLSKSTMGDLFHRTADHLEPVANRVLELIAAADHVHADETSLKVQDTEVCRRAFVWDFIAKSGGHTMVAYRFSPDRSGQTPDEVLGDSVGTLQVDGYTGYNKVTTPERRTRSGCWAHARRKFFAARETEPEHAEYAIDAIRVLYAVEYDAAERKIVGTDAHRALRRARSRPVVEDLFEWAEKLKPTIRPKSPLGVALKYLTNQRESLEVFLDDPNVALDNNISERHLRLIALGRKNFLFVGHDQAGRNFATLQTLVSSCIANNVNPQTYLTDVLMRVQDQPHSQIDELLPWNWRPPPRAE